MREVAFKHASIVIVAVVVVTIMTRHLGTARYVIGSIRRRRWIMR
jgi:hypothetical protein